MTHTSEPARACTAEFEDLSGHQPTWSTHYDLANKVLQVADPTGTYGFAYDNMGRLISTTTNYTFVAGTYTNSYSYDAASNRTSLTAPTAASAPTAMTR